MAVYDLGDVVALGVKITDGNGNLANATTVVCTITLPDGSTATPTVVNSATGVYDIDYTPTMYGRYAVRWVATGTNASAYADEFSVRDFTDLGIVSLDEVKAHLNIATDNHDEELRRFIDAATDLCENYVGSVLGRKTFVSEKYDGNTDIIRIRNPRVISITSVYENGVLLTDKDYMVDYTGQRLIRLASGTLNVPNWYGVWAPGVQNIVVTYVSGFVISPPAGKQGVLETIRHLWQTQRGPTSVLGRTQTGDDFYQSASYSLPRRAMELLDPLALPGLA